MIANLQDIVNRLKETWQEYQQEIVLFIGVVLISLLSFAAGYITAKMQEREPLIIEDTFQQQPEIHP